MVIRDVRVEDAAPICRLYNEHVLNSVVTFENVIVSTEAMESRIHRVTEAYPWLVMAQGGELKGYAYASQWRERVAYKHTVETAIYMDPGSQGLGLGRELYQTLLDQLSCDPTFHIALGAIALPNPGSIALHEKLGFKKVAQFPEVGRKFERWIDVGFWQYTL